MFLEKVISDLPPKSQDVRLSSTPLPRGLGPSPSPTTRHQTCSGPDTSRRCGGASSSPIATVRLKDKKMGRGLPRIEHLPATPKKNPFDDDVRAVITVRKKTRERLLDKIEDQWVSFINGIGRGILITNLHLLMSLRVN
nr:lipoxygenase 6, chloroplastic [Ipomoea batatas]